MDFMLSHKNNKQALLLGVLLLLGSASCVAGEIAPLPHHLSLSVSLPTALGVGIRDIGWQVQAQGGTAEVQHLAGLSPQLSLPTGQYDVSLTIGAYEEHKVVELAEDANVTSVPFTPKIGRLRVSSDAKDTDWTVSPVSSHPSTDSVLVTRDNNAQIDTFMAAGDYDVLASRGNGISHTQRLSIASGAVTAANIQMPGGKVSLIATLMNGPAMRPMSWTVYRLDGGRQTIAAPKRHSATLLVSPGHYEAVATLDGHERRRTFTVLTNTSNRIVVAMD